MINPASETFGQARQGSVAAIIQVLNEQLASDGIRTRAVVADGMLQILCEAAKAEQLDKETVVNRVRSVLETISPNRIRKVKINSRIVKEEQLLWLEEISRDPENALLWSEIITLKQPIFFQRWIRDRHLRSSEPLIKDVTEPEPAASLSTKLISGLALVALLLGAIWLFREDLGIGSRPTVTAIKQPASSQQENEETTAIDDANEDPAERTADTTPSSPAESSANNQPATAPDKPSGDRAPTSNAASTTDTNSAATDSGDTNSGNSGSVEDAFAEAVRIAEQAAQEGLTASSRAEWLALASRWQRASELMSEIPEGSDRYEVAVDRVNVYQTNSQSALDKAEAVNP